MVGLARRLFAGLGGYITRRQRPDKLPQLTDAAAQGH
jgi:hypothetical protein